MEPCVLVAQFGMARHYQNDFLMVRSVESWFISQLAVVTEMSRKCLHLKGAIGCLKSNTLHPCVEFWIPWTRAVKWDSRVQGLAGPGWTRESESSLQRTRGLARKL